MISSIASGTQIYSINQVTKTRATSAYSEATPTSPVSRMEQMQEKYKDVYSPMPASYSKEREELQVEKIREVYPDFLPFDEMVQEFGLMSVDPTKEINVEDLEAIQKINKEYIESVGGIEAKEEISSSIYEARAQYPTNKWTYEDFTPSNIKELTTFYNAAVYEGLEEGKDIQSATSAAYGLIGTYIDNSEYDTYITENVFSSSEEILSRSKVGFQIVELSQSEMDRRFKLSRKHEIGYGDAVDLRSYGFNMEWNHFDIVKNDNAMVSMLEKRVEMYDFMLKNPSVVDSEFKKLDGASRGGRTSERAILQPIKERHFPNAELALSVFEKYKIFDSVDIKA